MLAKSLIWGNSNWVLMDTEKQRPVPVPAALGENYGLEEKYPMEYAPRKIQIPKGGEKKEPLTITRAYLDSNQHVNNARYVQIAEEYIPESFDLGNFVQNTGGRREREMYFIPGDRA